MMDTPSTSANFFGSDARRRETILSEFEEAWFRGESPDIANYAQGLGSERQALVMELVHIDLEFRLKAGEAVRIESYLGRFPEIQHDCDAFADLICAEFHMRRRREPAVAADEYLQRFPELVEMLRARLDAPPAGETPSRHQAADEKTTVAINVISGPHQGTRYEADRHETLLVGRAADAHLRLTQDRHFSRFHMRLEINPPDCYLADLDSHNGTFVNGQPVKRVFLKHGDVISGGKTKIAFTVSSATQPPVASDAARNADSAARRQDPAALAGVSAAGVAAPVRFPTVPGYQLIEELGRGAMARVYRAVQKSTETVVALKIILPAHATQHQATLLFIREANVLSQLNHPDIVRFHEIGIAEGSPYLAMEYVPAIPHTEILPDEPGLPRMKVACGIACRVLDALHHAHLQSLVHRDVKTANVLLARTGPTLQVKLADFGLAKNYLTTGFSGITQDGDTRGTVAFMPPEQIRDCRYAKPTCDLYATGVTLYHYLCDQLPYEFSTLRSSFATVLNDDPTPLNRYCPDLPADLVRVIQRAIAKDGDRFGSASEMRQALLPFSEPSSE